MLYAYMLPCGLTSAQDKGAGNDAASRAHDGRHFAAFVILSAWISGQAGKGVCVNLLFDIFLFVSQRSLRLCGENGVLDVCSAVFTNWWNILEGPSSVDVSSGWYWLAMKNG